CLQREQRRIDLVRLRLHLGIEQQAGELADVIVGVAALQLVRVVLRLVVREWGGHQRTPWAGRRERNEAAAAWWPSRRDGRAALRFIGLYSSAPRARLKLFS